MLLTTVIITGVVYITIKILQGKFLTRFTLPYTD